MSMSLSVYSSEYDEDDDEIRQQCEHDLKWECPSTPMSMVRMTVMDLFTRTVWAYFVPLIFSAYENKKVNMILNTSRHFLQFICFSGRERHTDTEIQREREQERVSERERERELKLRNFVFRGL